MRGVSTSRRERIAEREVSPDASVQGGADEECDGASEKEEREMTVDEQTVLMIRGAIASFTEDQQAQVKAAKAEIEAIMEKYGEVGQIAISLVGAELAAKL